jgi:hypothetical protein
MTAREAVLAVARMGLRAETAEEGFAAIRHMTETAFSDAELAEALAETVASHVIRDPVRLLPGALQCHWRLEFARDRDRHGRA